MKRSLVASALLVVLLTSGGCAPTSRFPDVDQGLAAREAQRQMDAAAAAHLQHTKRLSNIAFRMSKYNVELCEETQMVLGILAQTLNVIPEEWKPSMRDKFGVSEELTVLVVNEHSPASKAGIVVGDKLIAYGGRKLGKGKRASDLLVEYKESGNASPTTITVRRKGIPVELRVVPEETCGYPIELFQNNDVNAFADGKRVAVSTGMMRFVEADEDLALIIGHELAHNARKHIESKLGNQLIGGLIGAFVSGLTGVNVTQSGMDIGALAYSQEFEAEADYVGVYFAARAGFDVRNAAELWRRIARIHPEAIGLAGSTHPSTAKRFIAIQAAADEIDRKMAAGLPLIPDER